MTVAREYFQSVLSPWVPGVENPIPALIGEIAGQGSKLAVDVGCGPGVLTCYLAQHFEKVIAIDRDPNMVEATSELVGKLRERGAELGQVETRHADWADCEDVAGADLVCAVNSMLETEPSKRRRMLTLLFGAMRSFRRPAANLLAVFPSMEAQVHLLRLYDARLRAAGLDEEAIRGAIEDEFWGGHHFDAYAGTFASRGDRAQKFVYELELRWELEEIGFEIETLTKLVYPWEVCRQVDAGYFPGEIELFDWFVRAAPDQIEF